MNSIFVTRTKNGIDVFVDTEHSHAATHLKDHPELLECMKEALSEREVTDKEVRFETDLGRQVGKMDLVETTENDDIFYAKRPYRNKYTRFVRGREAVPTNFVTIGLEKKGDTEYEVYTAFFGRLTPPFPYGKDDPDEASRTFWKDHALVEGTQEYLPETVTKECPW